MRQSLYSNLIVPAVAAFPNQNAGCCTTGAGGASSPQEPRSTRSGIVDQIAGAASGAAGDVAKALKRGGGCRCWWVAIAAVVVIALVAKQ